MPGLFDGTALEQPVTCERCAKPMTDCACPKAHPADQHPRVRREKRRGKWNTIISGLTHDQPELKALLKQLRTRLGTGGGITTTKGAAELLLQGDHRDETTAILQKAGYRAKSSGG